MSKELKELYVLLDYMMKNETTRKVKEVQELIRKEEAKQAGK